MFSAPTLIVDEGICRENIQRMVKKTKTLGITLRPHFKTHQSIEIGRWFREYGVDRIAVSSVPMARYFAQDGWNNITIAFPYVFSQNESINNIAPKVDIQLIVSSAQNAADLSKSIQRDVKVLVEIDLGQNRSGIQPNDSEEIEKTITAISKNKHCKFYGFLSHAGHSYRYNSDEIECINSKAVAELTKLQQEWSHCNDLTISYGDTPTSLICNTFGVVNELRPGNFVFFDMQQESKGICSSNNIAMWLACPLVAVYPKNQKAVIWGGAVHLSKDFYIDKQGLQSYGAVCLLKKDLSISDPIKGLYLESVSQEHGIIRESIPGAINLIAKEKFVAILPSHSCLTAQCMGEFWVRENGFVKTMKTS